MLGFASQPHKFQFSVDLKVAGTLRVPFALHALGYNGTRRPRTTWHRSSFFLS